MVRRKGFTLIELLAVVVILAIISAIAVPAISGIISNAQKSTFEDTVHGIIKTAELEYNYDELDRNHVDVTYTYADGIESSSVEGKSLIHNGEKPQSGTIIIDKNGNIAMAIHNGTYCAKKNPNDNGIMITETSKEECFLGDTSTITFIKDFGGSDSDGFNGVITVSDGYIVVGYSRSNDGDLMGLNRENEDAVIIKYDLEGNMVWKKTFGGSGNDSFIGVISVNDGYIVAGYSMSMDGDLTGLNQDWSSGAILVKYDLNGSVVWKKIFGGSNDDFFENVISVDDGYVAVGYGCSTDGDLTGLNKGSDDAFIVKYDVNGDMVWKKNYGGSSYDYYYGITSVSDGYVAVGNSRSMDGDLTGLNKGGSDAILVKYDVNGNVVWKKNYGGSNSEDFKHIISVSDGYVVVGYSFSMDGDLTGLSKGNQDAIIVKYDLNDNIVWKKNYGGSNSDVFSSVISVSDGYVAVGGSRSIDGDLTELNKGYEDAIIVKYDVNGNVVWKKNYSGSNSDVFSNVTPVNDGYVAVGYSFSNDGYLTGLNKGGDDAIIFKLNQNGEINLP